MLVTRAGDGMFMVLIALSGRMFAECNMLDTTEVKLNTVAVCNSVVGSNNRDSGAV